MPDWPDTEEEESGIFFTIHELEFDLFHPEERRRWLMSILENEDVALHRIDYILCSDEFLLDVNRTHLDHDFYTDIITFPLNDDPLLAEIYISVDRVRENASSMAVDFETELNRVMAHGVLHLCGYDDHEEDDIRLIRRKEEEYLMTFRF